MMREAAASAARGDATPGVWAAWARTREAARPLTEEPKSWDQFGLQTPQKLQEMKLESRRRGAALCPQGSGARG